MTQLKKPLHNQVLELMLKYRNLNPDFKFWLRQRDNKGRFSDGLYFQGTDTYAAVGLYDRGGGTNMTRSFILVFWKVGENDLGANVEIVWNEEKDEKIIEFYQKSIDLIGGFEKQTNTKYKKWLGDGDIENKVFSFLDNVKPSVDQLAVDMGLADTLFITENKFLSLLNKVIQSKSKSMLTEQQQKELIELFNEFKKTEAFAYRTKQFAFVPFAKKILQATVAKSSIVNTDLTALIQILKAGSQDHMATKYLPLLFEEFAIHSNFIKEFKELEYKGYTGAGKNGITKLSKEQLIQVKTFLSEAFQVNTVVEAVKLTSKFEALDIPEVKRGVYSPWLYYINPAIFPIINTKHIQFLEWMEVKTTYPAAIELFAEMKELLTVEELGILDFWIYEMEFEDISTESEHYTGALNTILFGPPGTGKTYKTIERALEIANPSFDLKQPRKLVKDEFKRLSDEGQIEFITFHQSLSYEDFIEGIKPVLLKDKTDGAESAKEIAYELKDGLFKEICNRARYKPDIQTKKFQLSKTEFDKASFFKISLGDTQNSDDDIIYKYCIENNCLAMGWGGSVDFSGLSEAEISAKAKENGIDGFAVTALNYFIHYLKAGNYVLISNGNTACRAIAKVNEGYYFDIDAEIPYKQFRKVEWLVKDVNIPVSEIYHKLFSQQSIYKLDKQNLKLEFFIKTDSADAAEDALTKNFVLIIDEINRGNVSQIFGELITLLEDDKREGMPEVLEVTLPYSKSKFSVPKNLYLIGTMNTADRSVEALDTALRRRFCFEEMLPDTEHESIGTVEGINLGSVLEKINRRLEKLLSRDHTIGHSFFIEVNDEEKLWAAFYNKILPLLQEYFFGDYGKIGLVLGNAFIKEVKLSSSEDEFFADFEYEEKDLLLERKVYRINGFEEDEDYGNFLAAVKAI